MEQKHILRSIEKEITEKGFLTTLEDGSVAKVVLVIDVSDAFEKHEK